MLRKNFKKSFHDIQKMQNYVAIFLFSYNKAFILNLFFRQKNSYLRSFEKNTSCIFKMQ
jgi:hypothetical protein